MKKLFFLILVILFSVQNAISAQESGVLTQDKLNKNNVVCSKKIPPKSFGYLNLGSSLYIQTLGCGRRIWNTDKTRAYDLSLNTRFLLLSIANDYVAPNFKFKYFKRYTTNENKYFGVGLELGVVFRWSRGYEVAYPNIELIWGKEREKLRFTQFSINLLPVAYSVLGFVSCAIDGCSGCNRMGILLGFACIPAFFEYTIGF